MSNHLFSRNIMFITQVLLFSVMAICALYDKTTVAAETEQPMSLMIKLVDGLTAEEQAAVIARNGGVEKSSISLLRLQIIEFPADELLDILSQYEADEQVEHVEINTTRKIEGTPSDPYYLSQWALPKIEWDAVFGSVIPIGVSTVAVLDTGIDGSHSDLSGSIVAGTSMLDGTDGLSDPNGHGTWAAGIVAAQVNNTGISGVGFANVRIMPITVLSADGTGLDSDIISGILYAVDYGADVILMGFSNPGFSQNLQDAIDYAWSQNVVLVAATGNDGLTSPTFPAGNRGVIGVSATDQNDLFADFSNSGSDVFLAAPGADILTTGLNDAYPSITGTSASAAIVAGTAGFMKAADPTLTNGVVAGRLARTADPAGTAEETGNGRVNMARAVSDAGNDFIQPAGAPDGGGPIVGPYVTATIGDGTGIMTVAPAIATAGSINNSFTFLFTATQAFARDSRTTIVVPAGWTAPQASNAADPGYITVTPGTCPEASIVSITGTGPWTITVAMVCNSANTSYTLTYAGGGSQVTAPCTTGSYTFTTSTKNTRNGILTPIASSPVISVINLQQTITVTQNAPGTAAYGTTFTVAATASSGLPVAITTSGVCSVSSGGVDTATIHMDSSTGTCTIYYNQAGDCSYNAAPQITDTTTAVVGNCFGTAWERTYDGGSFDYARGIASDSLGNVFVNGWTSGGYYYDFVTIKYDQDGNIIAPWPITYDSGYGNDYAYGVGVDGNDDVYVTGYSRFGTYPGTNFTDYDFVAVKYTNDGTELWAHQDDFGKIEYARSIAVSDSGNICVAGDSWNGSSDNPDYDYLTVKYDSTTGEVLWWNRWDNGSNGSDDSPRGVAVDVDGNVYVTGESLNGANNYDVVTVKYNSTCSEYEAGLPDKCMDNELWSRAFDAGHDDTGYAIAVDNVNGESYVYITGESFNGVKYDLMLIKYDSNGTLVWERTFDGGYDDVGLAVTVDDYHNIYLAGRHDNGTDVDFITLKYNSDGVLLNSWLYDSGDDDSPKGITTHETDVYVTGTYWPGTPGALTDFVTIKYQQLCDPFRITTPLLKRGTLDLFYSENLSAVSGLEPYTWSIASGALPEGLALDEGTGVISGTPSSTGTFNFTVLAEDSSLPTPFKAEKTFTIIITGIKITTSSLPNGTVEAAYNQTLSATGGPTPLTWSVVSGSLPHGLSLNSLTGVISGTPSLASTYSFSVRVSTQDAVTDIKPFTIQILNPLLITTVFLPVASVGTEYSWTLTASGGKTPYSWTVSSGALPDGLALSTSGMIEGTPSTAGLFTSTVQVTDSNGASSVKSLSIYSELPSPIRIFAGSPIYYSSIQTAYDVASGGDIIQIRSLVFTENLDLGRNTVVKLEGGYDATFTDNSGFTTISGSVTISNGTITIENVVIQ